MLLHKPVILQPLRDVSDLIHTTIEIESVVTLHPAVVVVHIFCRSSSVQVVDFVFDDESRLHANNDRYNNNSSELHTLH